MLFYSNRRNMSSNAHINLAKDVFNVKRGNFSKISNEQISYFISLLGESRVLTHFEQTEKYNEYILKQFRGAAKIVLLPKTTCEISKILSFCNNNNLAVCPQGGNTSMSGGSITLFDEILLSLSLMNQIISVDEFSNVLVCEAGCTLDELDQHLLPKNLKVPVDIAAKKQCQIGGNISTNAGGLRLLQYGNLQGSVLGLEVVKANGGILDCLNSLKKDNTGYHLKHLFIGSEGTLGVVTKVAIQCAILPKSYCVAFLGLESFEMVLKTFKAAKTELNEVLSACEMLDFQSIDMVQTNLKMKNAIGDYPFYMLLEVSGSNEKHNMEKLDTFYKLCTMEKLILNGVLASDPKECKELWAIRENVLNSMKLDGYVLSYDLSFSLPDYYTLVPELTKKLGNRIHRVSGLGHLGDGNLHLQVSLKEYNEELKKFVDELVYKRTKELKGSVSAEHGIGFMKMDVLKFTKSESAIQLMTDIKKMLDPNGILNPYKVVNHKLECKM